jgi:hypothetical protein
MNQRECACSGQIHVHVHVVHESMCMGMGACDGHLAGHV